MFCGSRPCSPCLTTTAREWFWTSCPTRLSRSPQRSQGTWAARKLGLAIADFLVKLSELVKPDVASREQSPSKLRRRRAFDPHDCRRGPHIEAAALRAAQGSAKCVCQNPVQPLIDFIQGPHAVLGVLYPLELRHRNSASVGQNVKQDDDVSLIQNFVGFQRRWAIGLAPSARIRQRIRSTFSAVSWFCSAAGMRMSRGNSRLLIASAWGYPCRKQLSRA
jgi:hypothetical protein